MPKIFNAVGLRWELIAIMPGKAPYEVIVIGFRLEEGYKIFDQSEVALVKS